MPLIRSLLQFETVADVIVRGVNLILIIMIAAGLLVDEAYYGYFDGAAEPFGRNAYLVGAVVGLIVAAPIVFAFFFAAKHIYGVNKQVEKIAQEDFLTGLLNRRAFFARIALQSDQRGSVALCAMDGHLLIGDADNFKRLNDTFGHPFGDQALLTIAGSFRAADFHGALAARIGGEEFGVFLPDTNPVAAHGLAEQIRKSVEMSRLDHESGVVPLSVSIGMTMVRKGQTLSNAMKLADEALYAAKKAGKNRVVRAACDSAGDMTAAA